MFKFKKRLKQKIKDETGASNTIEFLVALVFLCMITVTLLDLGFYSSNRNIVINAAQNGARLAAVYGGTGNENKGTPIAEAYGARKDGNCKVGKNVVECAVEDELRTAHLVNVIIQDINCTPTYTPKVGDRTSCEVKWVSAGIPGSAATFVKRDPENLTVQSAESEVIVNGL